MIYGEMSPKDRLIRGAIGAVLGAGAGLLVILSFDTWKRPFAQSSYILPAVLLGAVLGSFLAFRRSRI